MSKTDGRTMNLVYKLAGALKRLRGEGVQQVEVDAVSGIQHFKWSDPDLVETLEVEKSIVDANTATGLKGALPAPEQRALPPS